MKNNKQKREIRSSNSSGRAKAIKFLAIAMGVLMLVGTFAGMLAPFFAV